MYIAVIWKETTTTLLINLLTNVEISMFLLSPRFSCNYHCMSIILKWNSTLRDRGWSASMCLIAHDCSQVSILMTLDSTKDLHNNNLVPPSRFNSKTGGRIHLLNMYMLKTRQNTAISTKCYGCVKGYAISESNWCSRVDFSLYFSLWAQCILSLAYPWRLFYALKTVHT